MWCVSTQNLYSCCTWSASAKYCIFRNNWQMTSELVWRLYVKVIIMLFINELFFVFIGFRMNPSSWPSFLQKNLLGAEFAPDHCFKRVMYLLKIIVYSLICWAHWMHGVQIEWSYNWVGYCFILISVAARYLSNFAVFCYIGLPHWVGLCIPLLCLCHLWYLYSIQ